MNCPLNIFTVSGAAMTARLSADPPVAVQAKEKFSSAEPAPQSKK
jgi:hypothetical protein